MVAVVAPPRGRRPALAGRPAGAAAGDAPGHPGRAVDVRAPRRLDRPRRPGAGDRRRPARRPAEVTRQAGTVTSVTPSVERTSHDAMSSSSIATQPVQWKVPV